MTSTAVMQRRAKTRRQKENHAKKDGVIVRYLKKGKSILDAMREFKIHPARAERCLNEANKK